MTTATATRTPLAPRITKASPIAALLNTDGYKLSHAKLYPQAGSGEGDSTGTTRILINWTNRSNKFMPGSTHAVVFGLQHYIQSELVEAWQPFFDAAEEDVVRLYTEALTGYVGAEGAAIIGIDHVRALHRHGKLPLRIKALREGTLSPMGVATVTIENTSDEFFWFPNYIETGLSASIWHPSTVATIAVEFRELLEKWALLTTGTTDGVEFQGHDFSMRGQSSIESASVSAVGHLLSFLGTDTLPALDVVDRYYPGANNGWVAASVPATEHSVMCIRGEKGELATFHQILDTYPTGIVSAVSDGYDFFKVLTEVLTEPTLHKRIVERDGTLVIRPDSGDPVDIVTGEFNPYGDADAELLGYDHPDVKAKLAWYEEEKAAGRITNEQKGGIELLDEAFGHDVNEQGFKVLRKVKIIYGDSINIDRLNRICQRLAAKGYATSNVVFGIGSFTYQYITRDNLGSAVKATHAIVDGFSVDIQKDPKTGGGGKKSAKGRIAVHRGADGELHQVDELTAEQAEEGLLEVVWEDGLFYRHQSLGDIREVLAEERAMRKNRLALAA
jgi:nicotinamide phosphoribosyltransferase